MTRASPEYQLQCAVVAHLQARGRPNVYWTAIPMGEKRNAVTGARIKRMGGRAGAPDLLIIADGFSFGLELKAGRGALSESQKQARADWEAAGGTYAVARDIDEALDLLRTWGVISRGFDG